MKRTAIHFPRAPAPRQSGLALVIALIVLVAMTLASVGMVRSIDTAVLIAGNLAFRQGATVAGDAGVEAARTWLLANSGALVADLPANGYYATSQDALDLTGNRTPGNSADDVGWEGGGASSPRCLAADAAGNTVCYIIHRLCDAAGPLNSATCSTKQTSKGGSSQGGKRQAETAQPGTWSEVATLGYYRVTVRAAGPRRNASFIQTFLII